MGAQGVLERLRAFRPQKLLRVSAEQFYEQLAVTVAELYGTYHRGGRVPSEDEIAQVARVSEEAVRVIEMARLHYEQHSTALQNDAPSDAVRASYYGMIRGLLLSLQVRDFETIAHSRRVVTYALFIAEQMYIDESFMEDIALGAVLHDVGKLGISDAILHKPGKLTAAEYEVVKQHPLIGYRMLRDILGDSPLILKLVRHHHERYDGHGYPDKLSGNLIPREARILAVADAFDVMTTDRPYKKGRSIAEARLEVASLRGAQFCPTSADALLSLSEDVLEAIQHGEIDRAPFAGLLNRDVADSVFAPILPEGM